MAWSYERPFPETAKAITTNVSSGFLFPRDILSVMAGIQKRYKITAWGYKLPGYFKSWRLNCQVGTKVLNFTKLEGWRGEGLWLRPF
jgi:hypothetical protein